MNLELRKVGRFRGSRMTAAEFLIGLGKETAFELVKSAIINARRREDDLWAADLSALQSFLKRKYRMNHCECGIAISRRATRCSPCEREMRKAILTATVPQEKWGV